MRTSAGERWRLMQDAARGQALRLGDSGWDAAGDPYAGRVDSFRAGQRTDHNLVDCIASAVGADASVLEVGAGAGRLCIPLARAVRDVVALEPSAPMAAALEADAREQGVSNVRVVRGGWQDVAERMADAAFAAHVVYSLADIEAFVERLEQLAQRWCGLVVFAEPPQSRLFSFWEAVFGERRLPNPALPQVLDVLWSLGIYPDVKMLQVPIWPLGPRARAQTGLRRRLHVLPGSVADARLDAAITQLLVDWGDGVLGPSDRRPLEVGLVSWRPRAA